MSDHTTIPPADQSFNGNRKLVRPSLVGRMLRRPHTRQEEPLSNAATQEQHPGESSHAEAFYFQKQIQQKTDMVIILDDGERLEGQIEWYDRSAIKFCTTSRQRMLIYKSSVKYIYKASEVPTSTLL
ncbi:Hfq-like protein [Terriglobus tenax]|uniref:Hfq-like protein n=1 Tax=Terriglobus tenax TaxID=1111115 RepID=UPI0021DFCC01|nr:RNA chaperone Hfq [Terriglobus tenax]